MKRFFIVLLLLLLCGCTPSSKASPIAEQDTKTIAVLFKTLGNPHWQEMRSGIQDAATNLGANIILLYPETQTSTEQQSMMFRDILDQHPDALLWAPCDSSLGPEMETLAKNAGVPLFTLDTRAEGTNVPYIGADNHQIGVIAGEHMAEKANYTGHFAIISGPVNQLSHTDRVQGFLDTIEQYPNIEIIEPFFTALNFDDGMNTARDILRDYPDLDGIFCTSAVTGLGVAEEVKAEFKQSAVSVVTVDTQSDALSAISSGMLSGLVTQDGYQIGYTAIQSVLDSLSGKDIGQNIYLPAELITRGNIDDFMKKYLQGRDVHD